MMFKILPSITSLARAKSTWQSKIQEIQELNLSNVALFVTGLSETERSTCYQKLLELKNKHCFQIPFVHAVSDMSEYEYKFLINNFHTKCFNLHPVREFPLRHILSDELKQLIFIENATPDLLIYSKDLKGFGGICFDLSHLDDVRRRSINDYQTLIDLTIDFKVGANHISAVGAEFNTLENKVKYGSKHFLSNLTEFDYLSELTSSAFSNVLAIELENSLAEQVQLISKIWNKLHSAKQNSGDLAA